MKIKLKINKQLFALAILSSLYGSVMADTQTSNLKSTAKINPSCTLSVTDFNFGEYRPEYPVHTVITGSITTRCTRASGGNFTLNDGPYSSGKRKMKGSTYGDLLDYSMLDVNNMVITQDPQTSGSIVRSISITGTGSEVQTVIKARINRYQYLRPDSYSSTEIANISF